ncbi:MAG TPA: hypothetical protein VFQ92_00190 [Blastocatellia bacterium]|nr:hypothetical protein [Blastocatellia bacterium]
MKYKLVSMMLALITIYFVAPAKQAAQEYVDEAGRYKIALIGDWRPATYTDAVGRTKTEFVYGERSEALLRINRESLNRRSLDDIIRKEMEGLRLCQPGVTVTADEKFDGGLLPGRRLAFCYFEGNRWVAATFYFLRDRDTVWILRFTGRMGLLDANRDMTDQIARSFCPN